MNAYTLTVVALLIALLAESLASGLAIEFYLRKATPRAAGRAWLAIAISSLLLALNHGYTLELALRTGLYDLRQAVLAGLAGLFFALGVYGLRRQAA